MYFLNQICVSSVDFWESNYGEDLLKRLHKEKQYPPRLEMTVQLKALDEAQRVILSANFDGCVDDYTSPTFQLILPIGNHAITDQARVYRHILLIKFYALGHKPVTRTALENESALSLHENSMRFIKIAILSIIIFLTFIYPCSWINKQPTCTDT